MGEGVLFVITIALFVITVFCPYSVRIHYSDNVYSDNTYSEYVHSDNKKGFCDNKKGPTRGWGLAFLSISRLSGGHSFNLAVCSVFSNPQEPCVGRTSPTELRERGAVSRTIVPLEAKTNRCVK